MVAAVAITYPSSVPDGWHAPRAWLGHSSDHGVRATGAFCIHEHEGSFDSVGTALDRYGNVVHYYGGFQFLLSTWRSVGGVGFPHRASPREQLYRAFLVYRRDGGSWREWGTARACGLR